MGLFSEFGVESFPAVYPLISVYVCMTGAHGTISLQLRLIDADEERDLLFTRKQSELTFQNPKTLPLSGVSQMDGDPRFRCQDTIACNYLLAEHSCSSVV